MTQDSIMQVDLHDSSSSSHNYSKLTSWVRLKTLPVAATVDVFSLAELLACCSMTAAVMKIQLHDTAVVRRTSWHAETCQEGLLAC